MESHSERDGRSIINYILLKVAQPLHHVGLVRRCFPFLGNGAFLCSIIRSRALADIEDSKWLVAVWCQLQCARGKKRLRKRGAGLSVRGTREAEIKLGGGNVAVGLEGGNHALSCEGRVSHLDGDFIAGLRNHRQTGLMGTAVIYIDGRDNHQNTHERLLLKEGESIIGGKAVEIARRPS